MQESVSDRLDCIPLCRCVDSIGRSHCQRRKTVTTEAINLLNQVRTRAGLIAYTASSFSSARDFLDKLLIERAHEFYFEGCRRQDLIRDGSYVATMKQKCTDYGQVSIVNENYHRFPIPESAIIAGQGIIKQNPGY